MNLNIDKLYQIAQKQEKTFIGTMSGTSLDGLDVVLCRIKGTGSATELTILQFETSDFTSDFKKEIQSVFSNRNADLEKVCLLNAWIAQKHAKIINNCLEKWGIKATDVDILASHGQTIYHAPKILHGIQKFSNATLQIGDGDHLAVNTGIITLSDFRQKHIAAGGEGAPLAVYGDYFIFSSSNENRIMLNIGGIANFTYLPSNLNPEEVFSTDTGTGNTLMDQYIQKYFEGNYFDKDASIASKGQINRELLKALKDEIFFQQSFPKTTEPELFNLAYLNNAKEKSDTQSISHFDTMATLNRFSADTIVEALKKCTNRNHKYVVYSSGGGFHNKLLMQNIQEQLENFTFKNISSLNVNPDAKEAVLFAILANECICGGPLQFGKENKGIPNVTMGKISFPN